MIEGLGTCCRALTGELGRRNQPVIVSGTPVTIAALAFVDFCAWDDVRISLSLMRLIREKLRRMQCCAECNSDWADVGDSQQQLYRFRLN